MAGANFILGCSESFSAKVAETNGIPSYILDEYIKPARLGHLEIVNTYDRIRQILAFEIEKQAKLTPMAHILHDIIQNKYPKIKA